MRHRLSGRKFGRTASHRQALTRNQVTSLLRHGRIQTTEAKAKELRRWVERVVTVAKPGDVHAHRQAALLVNDREAAQKLFATYVERYRERGGGYTAIYKLGPRHGDGAPMALVVMVD
ncbi:MAG TPA: 50S ribosomal protein L17 [Candidatus Dormibacteraeota bacterium]|nr:50S ribosomal protein L17 [Candidatus Dormibacteraeota bacterium]